MGSATINGIVISTITSYKKTAARAATTWIVVRPKAAWLATTTKSKSTVDG